MDLATSKKIKWTLAYSLTFHDYNNDEDYEIDFGTWDIEETDLILNISIDGTIYTQRKPLNYTSTMFAFDVSKAESNVYVTDPGDTSASKIRILALEYTRL